MVTTVSELACIIGESQSLIYSLANRAESLYVTYYVPKKNGGKREINTYYFKCIENVSDVMDTIDLDRLNESKKLSRIHERLNTCVFRDLKISDCVVGFRKGSSIKSAAQVHSRKEWVVSIDIENFFPSVQSKRIKDVLIERYAFREDVAQIITKLVTIKGRLPQGARTSPYVSNIVFSPVDEEIKQIADKYNYSYTRYADDLIFSTSEKYSREDVKEFINEVMKLVKIHGFRINEDKIKIQHKTQQQYVLGLIVNESPNVPQKKKKLLKALIYNFMVRHIIPVNDPVRYKRSLLGKLNYLLYIKPSEQFIKLREKLKRFDPKSVKDWELSSKIHSFQ